MSIVLSKCSTRNFILGLYAAGLVGRVYSIYTGGALWLFNSPAFDIIDDRPNPYIAGPMAVLAEFGSVAFAAWIASFYVTRVRGHGGGGFRVWHRVSIVAMVLVEVAYFGFGLYKFGLLGVLLMPWVVAYLYRRRWRLGGAAVLAVTILVVFPVINMARDTIAGYYTEVRRPSPEWAGRMMETVGRTQSAFFYDAGDLAIIDGVMARLLGPEALIAAEKYSPTYGYEGGTTYFNLLRLVLPRAFRAWSSEPHYVGWEVRYVGLRESDPTVVPMPAVVEAYLNFGSVGVCIIMFLMGLLYKHTERLFNGVMSPLQAGLFSYIVWRLLNIEHNLFVYLLPIAKTVLSLIALAWIVAWSRSQDNLA